MNTEILDIRDLIERFENLENGYNDDEREEFEMLQSLFEQLAGYGGDEQWRGDWYPVTLIHIDYFTEYCMDFLQDCGVIPKDLPFYIENNINWDGVAEDLKIDYSEVEFNGNTYFYR